MESKTWSTTKVPFGMFVFGLMLLYLCCPIFLIGVSFVLILFTLMKSFVTHPKEEKTRVPFFWIGAWNSYNKVLLQ